MTGTKAKEGFLLSTAIPNDIIPSHFEALPYPDVKQHFPPLGIMLGQAARKYQYGTALIEVDGTSFSFGILL